MARGKKKESTLTPEEKLAQTLVPVEEQPYMVPENWCWANLGSYIDYATDYVANGSFASLKENVKLYKEENYALMVKTADFANGFTESLTYTDEHGYNYLSKSVLTGGELILSNIGLSCVHVYILILVYCSTAFISFHLENSSYFPSGSVLNIH